MQYMAVKSVGNRERVIPYRLSWIGDIVSANYFDIGFSQMLLELG